MADQPKASLETLARDLAALHDMVHAQEAMLNTILLTIALTPSQSAAIDRLLRDQADRLRKIGQTGIAARLLEKRQLILKTAKTVLAGRRKV